MVAHNDSPTAPSNEFLLGVNGQSPWSSCAQRTLDLSACFLVAIVAIPIVALSWLAVRLTSWGPGFYSQVRVGRKGCPYRIYKIRTMYHNCEAASGAIWSTKGDPRVTPLGRVLRKLHIDELPQLLNILCGDMSFVGPRPERPEFVEPLSEAIPGYRDRLRVRPGVTGLAQIQLPPDSDLDCVRKKVVLDRCYVEARGVWLDVRILLGTAVYLLGFSYDRVRKLVRLPNPLVEGTTSVGDSSVTGDPPLCRVELPPKTRDSDQGWQEDDVLTARPGEA